MIDETMLRTGTLLYEKHYKTMIKYAKKYVANMYDAEDIVSNCWIKILPKINKISGMESSACTAYLMRTVHNEIIDHHRKSSTHTYDSIELNENMISVDEDFEHLLIFDMLSFLFSIMPPQEVKVFQCKMNGFSNEEISEQLHISQSTVRVYLQRGRNRFRRLIQMLNN